MAPDQIYQPIVSDEDTESETPPASELSVVDPAEFRTKFETDEGDHLTVEEATAQRSRRPDPESAESAYERPITVHKVKGDGPISVNEATDALRWSRAYKLGGDLRAAGMTEDQINEMAADVITRGERLDPLMPPPPEAKVLEHFGENKQVLTPTQAAEEIGAWRERFHQQQQDAVQELVGAAVAQAEQAQQAPTEQPQPQQSDPQRQPQPQPEMTPAQIERAQLAAERQHITNLKRIEGHEAALRLDYDQLRQAVLEAFPGLPQATAADVEQLRVQDPARHAQLVQADQMLRQRQQRIAAIAHQRGVHQREQAQIDAVARAAARSKEDQHFEQLAEQHIPIWSQIRGEVTAQARKTLQNAGVSDSDIQRLWTGDEAVDAHSSVLQLVMAKAAQWDLAQEKARQVRQTNLPQVVRPGTYRSASDGDAQSVNELRARLKKATGREAIRLGTALTTAERAQNGG